MQISLSMARPAQFGGDIVFDLALRNRGRTPVALGSHERAFVWLFVVQKTSGAQAAYFTEKVPVSAAASNWPARLGDEIVRLEEIDLSGRQAYVYRTDYELDAGYPSPPKMQQLNRAGALNEILDPHKAAAKMYLYLPRRDQPMLMSSNTIVFEVAPPAMESLSPARRKQMVAKLIKQFDSGPWEGQQAHAVAVKLGRGIVPDLIEAVGDEDRKAFSLMWIATTLADIGDPRAAGALAKLLDHPDRSVRNVVAYHGTKLKSKELDAAITGRAGDGEAPVLTAWAVRGYAEFRKKMPENLLDVAINSDNPKARSVAAKALGRAGNGRNSRMLISLLRDDDENVRAAAAQAAAQGGYDSRQMIGALIEALDRPGERARGAVVLALCELTEYNVPYNPQADRKEKNQAIQAWKQWWAKKRNGR